MPDNLKLLKNVFAELEKPLFFGDGLNSGEFHALMQPGQFVSPNLKESDNSNDMAIISALTNDLIDTKFIYSKTSAGSIASEYEFIINSAALPYKPLTKKEKEEIAEIENWLTANRPTYTVFRMYYEDASLAYYQESNAQNPNPGKLPILYRRMNDALNDWNTIGKRFQFEQKQGRSIYLQSGDPSALWLEYRNRLAFHSKLSPQRGPYLQNFLIPSVSQWNSAGTSWATFEKTINESDSYNYSHTTSWGGGGSAGWGLWSFSAGGGGGSSYSHSTSDVATVSIKFDYLRVRIDRRWLESSIFNYRWWWWKAQFGYKLLSDGGNLSAVPPIRPIGTMPFMPQHMIVIKNLRIISNFSHNDQTTITSNLSASASFGWGPFGVKGSYSESTFEQSVKATFDGTAISIEHPQIIAFTGDLMPLTPNPDRTLPWQGDQAPFDPPEEAIYATAHLRREESDAEAKALQFAEKREASRLEWENMWEKKRQDNDHPERA